MRLRSALSRPRWSTLFMCLAFFLFVDDAILSSTLFQCQVGASDVEEEEMNGWKIACISRSGLAIKNTDDFETHKEQR